MIIRYYNGLVPLSILREQSKTSRNGTTLFHLKETLEKNGFECEGVKSSFESFISSSLNLPLICSCIINDSYKHFIVVYEINKKYILIADPSDSIKKVSYSYFKKIFNEAILLCKPKEQIPYIVDSNYDFISKCIYKNHYTIILLILYSIIFTFFSIVSSCYFGSLIDHLHNLNIIQNIFFIFFSMNILSVVIDYLRNKLIIYLDKNIDLTLTSDIINEIIFLPYRYYKNHTTGEIISRISDLSFLKDMISKIIMCLFIDIPLIILSIIFLYRISTPLFFLSLLILLLNSILIVSFKKLNKNHLQGLKNSQANYTTSLIETISGFELTKGHNLEKIMYDKIVFKYKHYLSQYTRFNKTYLLLRTLNDFINKLGIVIILYRGSIFAYNGVLKISSLVIFNTIFHYFSMSIDSLVNVSANIEELKIVLKRVNELVINGQDDGFLKTFHNGDIQIRNLSYSFDDKSNALSNINLTIKQGNKVLVIGKSGSGKSTLLKLLKGYYKHEFDSIYVGGIDINNYKDNLRSAKIAYLDQKPILFNDTLINNININREDNEKFLKIMNICRASELAKRDTLGYNQMIEEDGFNFSGGEKQRIALARFLLTDAQILIIDEALNQVDIRLEKSILSEMFEMFRDKTIIVISHRLDNYRLFNQIIELKEGRIVKNVSK